MEFTRDGRHVLASVWEDDGALIVYDAATFAEVTRCSTIFMPPSLPAVFRVRGRRACRAARL